MNIIYCQSTNCANPIQFRTQKPIILEIAYDKAPHDKYDIWFFYCCSEECCEDLYQYLKRYRPFKIIKKEIHK